MGQKRGPRRAVPMGPMPLTASGSGELVTFAPKEGPK